MLSSPAAPAGAILLAIGGIPLAYQANKSAIKGIENLENKFSNKSKVAPNQEQTVWQANSQK